MLGKTKINISLSTFIYFIFILFLPSQSISNPFSDCHIEENEYSINVTCRDLSSFEGLTSTLDKNKLTYVRLSKYTNHTLSNPNREVNKKAYYLTLSGTKWNDSNVEILTTTFPNVKRFECKLCNLRDLRFLKKWNDLKEIHIDEFPIIDSISNVMARVKNSHIPYNLEGLDYDKIDKISVNQSPKTNFTCDTIGLWGQKIEFTWDYRSYYPLPYRDLEACFSVPHRLNLNRLIQQGDELYKEKDLNGAHKIYRKALEKNPWDLKAISSYILTSYRLKKYCDGMDVGYFGSKQKNGSKSTIASVNYNLYLLYNAVGDTINAKKYLLESNKIKPSESNKKKLSLIDTTQSVEHKCNEEKKWLASYRNSFDEKALSRDRNLPKKKFTEKLNFSSYQVIASHQGKKKVDNYYADWPSISLSPGYYGVVIHSDKPLDFWLGKGDLQCVYPKNSGLTTYTYQGLSGRMIEASKKPYQSRSVPEGKIAYLIDVQKNKSFESTGELACQIHGENWYFKTDNFTFNLVKFDR